MSTGIEMSTGTDAEDVPVLVTTIHRGVFFGFAKRADTTRQDSMELRRVRCCIYWSRDIGGFLGLASRGPSNECKIGSEAPSVLLHGITSCSHVTEEAVARWKAA